MKTLIKKRINLAHITEMKAVLRSANLNTVCEDAKCPNIGECFSKKIATLLIAGNICTRGCKFCAIKKGSPLPIDSDEPVKAALMIKKLELKYVVITSVTRDDLHDGGADHYYNTVKAVRNLCPNTKIEILVPDFKGQKESAEKVFQSCPDVFSHNLETVPALYEQVRIGADYYRSLSLLGWAKEKGLITKSGLMLGLGETKQQVINVMDDLRAKGCDILTLGQYLAPTKNHHQVMEYISETQFSQYKQIALEKGFSFCTSGSYVRSSYMADLTQIVQ